MRVLRRSVELATTSRTYSFFPLYFRKVLVSDIHIQKAIGCLSLLTFRAFTFLEPVPFLSLLVNILEGSCRKCASLVTRYLLY